MSATMDNNQVAAEIARLNAETARLQAETVRLQSEARVLNIEYSQKAIGIDKLIAETLKLQVEPDKVFAETRKLDKESRWFPAQVIAGCIAAVFAIFAGAAALVKFLDWFKP